MSINYRQSVRFMLVLLVVVSASLACRLPFTSTEQTRPDNNTQNQQQNQNQVQDQGQDQNQDQGQNQNQIQGQDQNPDQGNNQQNTGEFEITGIWESQVETSAGTVSTKLILEPTGTFTQTVIWGQLMTYDTGEYNIIQNAIHFTVTRHEPTEYLGKPMTWPASFTYFVYPIDATSMTVEDRIMKTSWTMVKTGP